MDIYKAILKDHEIQRDLCDKILKTSGESPDRRELWTELRKELEVHEVAEERYFYSPLIDKDKMQDDARHGMAEHHEIDELIEEIEGTEMVSPHWLSVMKKLSDKVHHHLEDEEEDFFGKAKEIYSKNKAEELADGYEKTKTEYKNEWPESIPGSNLES